MSKIISIHSFRGGTGKSNISANLAFLLFSSGKRVGIIDGDIASPGIHILFGIDEGKLEYTLNDFLWDRCSIEQTAVDITDTLEKEESTGKFYIIPSSLAASDIAKVLRDGYNIEKLIDGIHEVIEKLQLDYLIIDTHPGVNEETLLSISVSDLLIVVMRPDSQDYQGTAVTIELAKKLEVPKMCILVNKTLPSMDIHSIEKQVEEAYETPIACILPFSEEMALLASSGVFAHRYPDHPITQSLQEVTRSIDA